MFLQQAMYQAHCIFTFLYAIYRCINEKFMHCGCNALKYIAVSHSCACEIYDRDAVNVCGAHTTSALKISLPRPLNVDHGGFDGQFSTKQKSRLVNLKDPEKHDKPLQLNLKNSPRVLQEKVLTRVLALHFLSPGP